MRNRRAELIANTYPRITSYHKGSSRIHQRRWKGNRAARQNSTHPILPEHRSNAHQDIRDNTNGHFEGTSVGRQLTYAAADGTHKDKPITTYKPATFHTIDMDNIYPYLLEDIPHRMLTCNYSGSTLPKNEIVFRYIFKRGQPATREVLQACRTYTV